MFNIWTLLICKSVVLEFELRAWHLLGSALPGYFGDSVSQIAQVDLDHDPNLNFPLLLG
jgi:hypothetical protein